MIISAEQQASMLEAAKPLIAWMNKNCHPHCEARVDQIAIVLSEGVATNLTYEFVNTEEVTEIFTGTRAALSSISIQPKATQP